MHIVPGFYSHDSYCQLTITLMSSGADGAKFNCRCKNADPNGCINIILDKNDIQYKKRALLCLELKRSEAVPNLDCEYLITVLNSYPYSI